MFNQQVPQDVQQRMQPLLQRMQQLRAQHQQNPGMGMPNKGQQLGQQLGNFNPQQSMGQYQDQMKGMFQGTPQPQGGMGQPMSEAQQVIPTNNPPSNAFNQMPAAMSQMQQPQMQQPPQGPNPHQRFIEEATRHGFPPDMVMGFLRNKING